MPRVAVLPDADHLRDGILASVLYVEEVSLEDFDDEYVARQIRERLKFAIEGRLMGEVAR